MSVRIHSSGIAPASTPVDDAASPQSASGTGSAQGHHHHHGHHHLGARKPASRPRTKRRRGADSQDGVDESGASEELLMMLEEHLQKNAEMVMRVGERRQGSGDRHGGGQQGDSDHEPARVGAMRGGKRLKLDAPGAGDIERARADAQSALLDARRAQAIPQTSTVSTYEVLIVMREFLALPDATAHASVKLAAIRVRLVEAVEKPVARAPARQHSLNLLLPLMLLNLERKRTDEERALALAKISSLLGHRRARV